MPIAVVTGGAFGLGAGIAKALTAEGYRVALVDIDANAVGEQARQLPQSKAYALDITDEAKAESVVQTICDDLGTPDLLVNNAGIVRFGGFLEHSVADFRRTLDVHVVGTFIMSQIVCRRMARRGSGNVVNITSLNAFAPSTDVGAYPAAKAAIAKLTEQMAISLGQYGIRVNAVAPGWIDGGMSKPIYEDPVARKTRSAQVPIGKLGSIDDVAQAVVFLASDKAGYITGQHLLIDGGINCSLKNHLRRAPPLASART